MIKSCRELRVVTLLRVRILGTAPSKMANADNASDVSDTEGDQEQEWTTPEGKNSFVWDHFKLNKDKSHVKCDHCDMVFKFSSASSVPQFLGFSQNMSYTFGSSVG